MYVRSVRPSRLLVVVVAPLECYMHKYGLLTMGDLVNAARACGSPSVCFRSLDLHEGPEELSRRNWVKVYSRAREQGGYNLCWTQRQISTAFCWSKANNLLEGAV